MPVEIGTVKALLVPRALARLTRSGFHFCAGPGCRIVYFSDNNQTFDIDDVRVLVWQKQPPGARMLCYCFGENEADMTHEIAARGRTLAIERVRRHIADRRCACEIRNPRGACCLGDLTASIKVLMTPNEVNTTPHGVPAREFGPCWRSDCRNWRGASRKCRPFAASSASISIRATSRWRPRLRRTVPQLTRSSVGSTRLGAADESGPDPT
jgi:hypothetical protein